MSILDTVKRTKPPTLDHLCAQIESLQREVEAARQAAENAERAATAAAVDETAYADAKSAADQAVLTLRQLNTRLDRLLMVFAQTAQAEREARLNQLASTCDELRARREQASNAAAVALARETARHAQAVEEIKASYAGIDVDLDLLQRFMERLARTGRRLDGMSVGPARLRAEKAVRELYELRMIERQYVEKQLAPSQRKAAAARRELGLAQTIVPVAARDPEWLSTAEKLAKAATRDEEAAVAAGFERQSRISALESELKAMVG
jgi:hypothetical protein